MGAGIGAGVGAGFGADVEAGDWARTEVAVNTSAAMARNRSAGEATDLLDAIATSLRVVENFCVLCSQPCVCA